MQTLRTLLDSAPGRRVTPQDQQAHPAQVPNHAGGFGFAVDDWKRLERFLILGSENGTFYVSEKKLTEENAAATLRCVQADGVRAVRMIVEISDAGRAYRNTPAVFALAVAAGKGDPATRKAAAEALPKVARTGTHLFEFLEAVQHFRGWGPSLRRAVASWYTGQPVEKLAQQLLKYRQRGGWNHHAALHLCHAKADAKAGANAGEDVERNHLFRLAKSLSAEHKDNAAPYEGGLPLVRDFLALREGATLAEVLAVIERQPAVTWEMVPGEHLGEPQVWEALLKFRRLPITALIRNLGRMTANGVLNSGSGRLNVKGGFDAAGAVVAALNDAELLRRGRVHPVQCLAALLTYKSGRGGKGSLTWGPVGEVVDALDRAFYACFRNVRPTGKAFLYGLDVSGSMTCPDLMDVPGLSPRVGSAAMAMACARVEPRHAFLGFSHELVPVPITAGQSLAQVVAAIDRIPMGGTDCALPMLFAAERKLEVDTFVVLTDSETWFGKVHPHQALERYRREVHPAAKLVVVGMTSSGFTIANPDDAGMLDCVGFDSAVPNVVSDFAAAG